MLKISELMTKDVFTLLADATAEDASWELTMRGIGGAPVVDRRGRLVGVLSKGDLLDPERRAQPSTPVRDIMTGALIALAGDEPAMAAVELMVREGVHRVIVVDEAGSLAGIVTPTDVLRALVRGERLGAGEDLFDAPGPRTVKERRPQ